MWSKIIEFLILIAKHLWPKKKDTSERTAIKKRIKELNREIRRNKKELRKAIQDIDYSRYDYYYEQLRKLKARRKELREILCK